jgi:SAM-dependent methyltransferase
VPADDAERYVRANRELWDAITPHHVASRFYDVEGFKAGRARRRTAMDELEVALVGDVRGKTLLHLQCHFGIDTIRWAQRGAIVTGIDFSGPALEAARRLAAEMGVPATFVESDVADLRRNLQGCFDVVFTSHGVLGWLPDLERWAQVIAHFLAPGGRLHLIEAHPFAWVFDDQRTDGELRVTFPYFPGPEPLRFERDGSYAAPDAPVRSVEHTWMHPLADILGALLRAGLRLESFAEYPYVAWAVFPWMEERADGAWQLPGGAPTLPLMFSLSASKPA